MTKAVRYFRQSGVNDARMCLEMTRQKQAGSYVDRNNDSALIGTAVHAGIEAVLYGLVDQYAVALEDAVDEATGVLQDGWGNCRQTLNISLHDAMAMATDGVTRWWKGYLPSIITDIEQGWEIIGVEQGFEQTVAVREDYDIGIQGTADLVMAHHADQRFRVIDWKTSKGAYGGSNYWKHDRYSVQPTFYLTAFADMLGMPIEHGSFEFVRIGRGQTSQEVEVTLISRTVEDTGFLITELDALAGLDPAKPWPLGPSDWWCSPKWCPHWKNCRGSFIGGNPWGTISEELAEDVMSVANDSF